MFTYIMLEIMKCKRKMLVKYLASEETLGTDNQQLVTGDHVKMLLEELCVTKKKFSSIGKLVEKLQQIRASILQCSNHYTPFPLLPSLYFSSEDQARAKDAWLSILHAKVNLQH